MDGKVSLWGNSLAVRIPKAFADQADLQENSRIEILLDEKRIVIQQPVKEWKLQTLLRGIKRSALHDEIDWRGKTGNEVW